MKKLTVFSGLVLLPALIFSLEAVFFPNPVTGIPGEEINFNIEVNGTTSFRGYRLVLNYDDELFTFNSAAYGDLFVGQNIGWWLVDNDPGELTIECIIFGYGLYVTGPGSILELKFTGITSGTDIFEISEFICYDVDGSIIPDCSAENGYLIVGRNFSYTGLKVWLEGAYQDGIMTTLLSSSIPLDSPYPEDPVSLTELPPDMVDWLLVELRAEPSGIALSYTSCILKTNGTVSTGEFPFLLVDNTEPGDYYVVVRHRNHLALMSSYGVSFQNSGNYSFCNLSRDENIFGNSGHKLLDSRICGMIAGDADGDGIVAPSDRNLYWRVQTGLSGYLSADFNLSGNVSPADLNECWRVNTGMGSQVPSSERLNCEMTELHKSVEICYEFGENEVFLSDGNLFYQIDILASVSESGTSLGSGMILLNYNSAAFGEFIYNCGDVEVQPLDLLQTGEYSLYNLIVQDNSQSRLAVTFEYTNTVGYGNPLCVEVKPLMRLIFPVMASGESSHLNFQEGPMRGQQYYDDNSTIFDRLTASDSDNTILEINSVEPYIISDKIISVINYPNPGNPSTVFKFTSRDEYNLRIYNIRGQLVNEFVGTGKQNEDNLISWNGCDIKGNVVRSGIYFYQIEAGKSSAQGKVTILK